MSDTDAQRHEQIPEPVNRMDHWWPWRPSAAPAWLLWVGLGLALFGSWSLIRPGIGVGFTVSGLVLLGVATWRAERSPVVQRLVMTLLAAALWTVPTWRAATWVVALSIMAALVTTWFAVAMPRRLGALPRLVASPFTAIPDALAWARRGLRAAHRNQISRGFGIAVLSGLLALVFGGLFAAADAAFASVVRAFIPDVSPGVVVVRLLVAAVMFLFIIGLFYLASSRPRFDDALDFTRKPANRLEWTIPLTVVNGIFALFIVVQARAFFGGEEYLMTTAGLTYAEYARSGFWQLSIVSVLSLAVIAVAAWRAPHRNRADRLVLRLALGSLCVMSLLVVASALYRMNLYSEAYGLTRLRVWVFAVEIFLAVLFGLILACGVRLRITWLSRAAMGAGASVILGLALINPEGLIAQQNLARYEETGKVDFAYLATLSVDAVPDLVAGADEPDRGCLMRQIGPEDESGDLLSWNLARERAAELMATSFWGPRCDWVRRRS